MGLKDAGNVRNLENQSEHRNHTHERSGAGNILSCIANRDRFSARLLRVVFQMKKQNKTQEGRYRITLYTHCAPLRVFEKVVTTFMACFRCCPSTTPRPGSARWNLARNISGKSPKVCTRRTAAFKSPAAHALATIALWVFVVVRDIGAMIGEWGAFSPR